MLLGRFESWLGQQQEAGGFRGGQRQQHRFLDVVVVHPFEKSLGGQFLVPVPGGADMGVHIDVLAGPLFGWLGRIQSTEALQPRQRREELVLMA